MITIPTTELIGGLADMIPHIQDEKGATAGIVIAWDGEELTFSAFDTFSGAEVRWVPGEGAEGDFEPSESGEDIEWGGDDSPWRVFIWLADAKEIVKLFKLPSKLWWFPVRIKCNVSQTKLTIERDDMTRGNRLLVVSTYNDVLKHIPSIPNVATGQIESTDRTTVSIPGHRLAPFGLARPHGDMSVTWGTDNDPVRVTVGSRLIGFVFMPGKRYNVLQHGAGIIA